jgi:PAS domain S-box-containing protein
VATILIVDDCPEHRRDFAIALQPQGHRLLEASDGADAVALARSERPHLIIADTRAPKMDGCEIVRHLRSERDLAKTRIILYSDRDFQREAIELAHAVEVPVVLPKPSKAEEIVRMVDLALNETKGRVAPGGRRRMDREHPRPLPTRRSPGATELERMKSEIAHLKAELRCRDAEHLKSNESLLAESQQLAHIGSWSWDIESGSVVWSDEHYRIFGLRPQEIAMTYDRVMDIVYPDDRATMQNVVDQALQEHQPFDYSLRVLHKDGTVRYVQSRGRVEFDDCGKPARMFGTIQDITERTQADRRLRESEERFRQLAEYIDEVFWMVDPMRSQVIYVSPAYEKIWGRTRESLYRSPLSWTDIIHPGDRGRVVAEVGKMGTRAAYSQTYRIVRPDGSIRWIRDRAFPIYDTAGQLIRMAGIAQDITDLKNAEEELRRYSARLEAMSLIDHAILATRSPPEIAQAVVSHIRRLVPCQQASVVTCDVEAGQASFLAVSIYGESHLPSGACIPIDALGDIQDLRAGQPRNVEDLLALPQLPPVFQAILEEGSRSCLLLPIISRNELIGFLKLRHGQPAAFNREHVEIADEIAARVAVALQDARLYEQVCRGQERMRALSGQLMKAQEDERRRISRELHDEIGQALTVTKVSLEALKQTANDLASATEHTMTTVQNTVQQVRNMSLDLRPPMLDDLGLAAALRTYLDRQAQCAGFFLEFEVDPAAHGVSPEIETACFRVAQEAMTNIVRHARPHQVRVELRHCETGLQLRIHDDGIGFDVAMARQRAIRGESLGLLGMEERVAILGGQIEIKSGPGQGTEVQAYFPIHVVN